VLERQSKYTVSQKKRPTWYCPSLQILTNFQNSFTGTLAEKLAIK